MYYYIIALYELFVSKYWQKQNFGLPNWNFVWVKDTGWNLTHCFTSRIIEHAYPEILRKLQKRCWPNKFKKRTLAFRLYLFGLMRSKFHWGSQERNYCLKTNLRIPKAHFCRFHNLDFWETDSFVIPNSQFCQEH